MSVWLVRVVQGTETTNLRVRQKRASSLSFQFSSLALGSAGILFLLFLLLFVFNEFFLFPQNLKFLLVAGLVGVDF